MSQHRPNFDYDNVFPATDPGLGLFGGLHSPFSLARQSGGNIEFFVHHIKHAAIYTSPQKQHPRH